MGWKKETTLGEWCVLSTIVLVAGSFLVGVFLRM